MTLHAKDPTKISCTCGLGCTLREKELAYKRGAKLAKRMGKGWTVRVWDNLGWHYSVRSPCGRITIHAYHFDHLVRGMASYCAFLSTAGDIGGQFTGQAKAPEIAVSLAVRQGMNRLQEVANIVAGLETWSLEG